MSQGLRAPKLGLRSAALVVVCAVAGVLGVTLTGCSSNAFDHPQGEPVITGVVRVEQPTVQAGDRVRAELVLHNSSGHARLLDRGCPHGFIQLTLSKAALTAGGIWALPACTSATFTARPGTTTYPLAIPASYSTCGMRGHKRQAGIPQCVPPGNSAPPLPSGSYMVRIAASDAKLQHELAHVRPGRVQIVR
jgi:hypothetical protein